MRRLPVFILIDTSGSMFGEPIESVNVGLATMLSALRQDPYALDTVYLSVITFDREVREVFPLTPLEGVQMPTITCPESGPTFMGEALKLVAARVDRDVQRSAGEKKGDWQPMLFLITDGSPSDVALFDEMVDEVKRHRFGKIIGCAAGSKAKEAFLRRLTDTVVSLETMDSATFSAFFKWVSASVGMSAASAGIDRIDVLSSPPAEVRIDLIGVNRDKIKTRDDFSQSTKRTLAERAGYRCSFPGCLQTTIGPSEESEESTSSVGMACHIAAASGGPGARRHIATMTAEERSSISNGIWMCYTHGKLIDTDETRYTNEMLRCWKQIAERRAQARLEGLVEDEYLQGIAPGTCTLQIPIGGSENEIVGNAVHETCLPELWGRELADALRDLVIEIIRNAFDHGKAQSVCLDIGNDSIKIVDDGRNFDSWQLFNSARKQGGTLAFQRIVKDFSHRIVVTTKRINHKNSHEFTYVRKADDILYVTPCSVELTWKDLERKATKRPLDISESCRIVYIVLPRYTAISDAVVSGEKFYDIRSDGRQFIFVTDRGLSKMAKLTILENFPESMVVNLGIEENLQKLKSSKLPPPLPEVHVIP
uniref:Uncharacterized conserved protein YegL, contains vWA domain of TerY type n=1 Tax=Candidatus Kentrum eta TaxID=2126337 RepID=A0A450URH5_9GAMM|nr:MAG: Uncharacterized conserved protein YegL, contains vWA domain of TerY type [Candidatus Kentron sp. H]VFJ95085.1 MAG: Uncharacterized conserved protein YegL, contains vWA domain of TerY type [Candidatus Kentron sp. H]VFK00361.1 MAG: Uncharacterized conserved protein YegL, contains vWA domain of TerY type [Candidatus Kentron sp. H]